MREHNDEILIDYREDPEAPDDIGEGSAGSSRRKSGHSEQEHNPYRSMTTAQLFDRYHDSDEDVPAPRRRTVPDGEFDYYEFDF